MKRVIALSIICGLFLVSYTRGIVRSQSPAPETSVTQDIKERVQKVLNSDDSKVNGATTKTTFGIVGTLEKSVGSTLSIRSYNGQTRIVEVFKDAVIISANKQITKEELELNTPIVVMGTLDDNQTYTGKRIIVADDSVFPSTRTSTWGKVVSLTTRSIVLTPQSSTDTTSVTLPISTQTKYYNIADQAIKRTDLKPDDEIVVIAVQSQVATASALRVYSLATPAPTP